MDLMRAAMDLARFKNIDLATASEALIRIEGGQFRALKGLIGVTTDITTAEQALAAVHLATAGAAQTFADTNQGKLLASQIKLDEAMEKFGYVIMPAVTEAMVAFADTAPGIIDNLHLLADAVNVLTLGGLKNEARDRMNELAQSILRAQTVMYGFKSGAGAAAEELRGAAWEVAGFNKTLMAMDETRQIAEIGGLTTGVRKLASGFRDAHSQIIEIVQQTPADIAKSLRSGREEWKQALQDYIEAAHTTLPKAAEIAQIQGELAGHKLASGLRAKRPEVVAAARVYEQSLKDRLFALQNDVPKIALDTGQSYADALKSKRTEVGRAADEFARTFEQGLPTAATAAAAAKATAKAYADGLLIQLAIDKPRIGSELDAIRGMFGGNLPSGAILPPSKVTTVPLPRSSPVNRPGGDISLNVNVSTSHRQNSQSSVTQLRYGPTPATAGAS
jgi:hypothetical protein